MTLLSFIISFIFLFTVCILQTVFTPPVYSNQVLVQISSINSFFDNYPGVKSYLKRNVKIYLAIDSVIYLKYATFIWINLSL